jgi:hypothetical protein
MIQELSDKYSIKNEGQPFFHLRFCTSINYTADCEKIDGIYEIEESYNCYRVKGYYNVNYKTVDSQSSIFINGMEYAPLNKEEKWKTIKGKFKKDINIYIPEYLFSISLDDVYKKMEEEFKEDFENRCNKEIEYWNEEIKEAKEMIIKTNKIKAKIMEK